MAKATHSNQQTPQSRDGSDTRSHVLEPLQAFVGTWSTEFMHVALPNPLRGQATFEWLEGGQFLIMRSFVEDSRVPEMIGIIGVDASGEGLVEHYFDSRGVSRVYQMSLRDGIWRVWRDAPGFSQRSEGSFSDDSKTIKVRGELRRDDVTWEYDWEQSYTKV